MAGRAGGVVAQRWSRETGKKSGRCVKSPLLLAAAALGLVFSSCASAPLEFGAYRACDHTFVYRQLHDPGTVVGRPEVGAVLFLADRQPDDGYHLEVLPEMKVSRFCDVAKAGIIRGRGKRE